MKISWNWLREILPVDMDVHAAAELLTDIGLEVESVATFESIKGGLEGLITGEVVTCEKHPDADKLKITEVNIGSGELLHIVCGAPNVAAGQKVIVATVGTTVYPVKGDPFMIKKAKIRGQESNGMLCAEDEIGLGESHEGLLILPENTPVGIPVKTLFAVYTDATIEIGLTANHADANSHIGTARELRAALISRNIIVLPPVDITSGLKNIVAGNNDHNIQVRIDAPGGCHRYSGVQIRNITIHESPQWLQQKLKSIGLRPINNVVDITNYILHHYGQPLHAFDADKINGNTVIIRTLPDQTSFTTLDGKERKMHSDDLMICDATTGMCIAGVYGGLHYGISDSTSNVFIESACFNAGYIRRTESRHSLKTDASARFAKGTDPEMTMIALQKAVALILELCGGSVSGPVIDLYPVPVAPAEIFLRYQRLKDISAIDIPSTTIISILTALNIFILEENALGLRVQVPAYKNDVLREIDLIEEILRMYGFNNIPVPSTVRMPYLVSPKPDREKIKLDIISFLSGQGMYEIYTNAISKSKYTKQFLPGEENHVVQLLNSLNADLDSMRSQLLFTGLEVIAHNIKHKRADLQLFEFGRTYIKNAKGYSETEKIALYFTGGRFEESWRQQGRTIDFFDLKQIIDNLLNEMHTDATWETHLTDKAPAAGALTLLHDGAVLHAEGKSIGVCGLVKKEITEAFDIKQKVFYAEIEWEEMMLSLSKLKTQFREIARFPEMRRDLALILDRSVAYGSVEKIARKQGRDLLKDIVLFDVYEGEKLAGKKSYAVGLTFGNSERTLTDKEVDEVMQQLMSKYEKELGAIIRK